MDTNEHDPSDGEWYLDPESLYQNLLAHKMNLDLGAASKQSGDSAAEKAQALRTLLTTNSFSEQTSDSQSGWHMERLEKYTALMDGTIENGGLNNHRGAVEQRLTGVNPVHSTWKVEESIPSMPTDADIEEHILSAEQFRAVYQDPLKAAQAKFSSGIQPARVVAKRKAVPANSGFTVPRRDTSRINNPAVLPEKLGHSQSGSVEGPRPPESETVAAPSSFKTAKEQLVVEMVEKGETVPAELKAGARPLSQPFVAPVSERNRLPPMAAKSKDENEMSKLVEMFEEYVVTPEDLCDVGEVVGLDDVKQNLELSVILPLMVECSGLNIPPKGLLLFGPPGTGKTLIGRWVAAQLVKGNDDWKRTVFISVTPSTLTSKWTGESEKLVRAMFQYARTKAPAVIFMDEVDALLSRRNSEEHESSRRMKTEFLAQMEGIKTDKDKKVFVIGATNRPQEIDDAARRRFTHRLYVPLPDKMSRTQMLTLELNKDTHSLTSLDIETVAEKTANFSGADVRDLCRDAFRAKFRRLRGGKTIKEVAKELQTQKHPITLSDVIEALSGRTPSVDINVLKEYEVWKQQFGTGQF